MSNQQLYSVLYVTGDGTLLTEETGVSMRRATNSHAVMTTAKGYAGESPGAPMAEYDVKNAIPAAGLEFDMGARMASLTAIELGLLGPGGKTAKVKCTVYEDSIQHSVNAEGAYDFKARGPMPQFV